MVLTIKAMTFKGQLLGSPLIAEFGEQGGTLGRAPHNNLVLVDDEKFVSSEHAVIKYENGAFYYVDTSLNGSEFSGRNQRIHQAKILIEDQDTLRVGDYELVLSLSSKAQSDPPPSHQEALSLSMFDQESDENCEPPTEDFFDNEPPHDYPEVVAATNNDHRFELDGSFVPPDVVAPASQPSELPDDLSLDDFFSDEPSAPAIKSPSGAGFGSRLGDRNDRQPPVHPSPPALGQVEAIAGTGSKESSADILDVFFKAAGIKNANAVPQENVPELMHTIGAVLRELVEGLMMVLRGRSELKSHLRVSMTMLKPTENNPLKFSTSVEEALTTFLTDNHPGFVDAVDAVREGYENIKNHQMALNAGVQASLAKSLKRFDPQHFSEKFEEGIVLQKKAKCWDEYRQAYQNIVQEALDDFFGEQFVRAYEKQIGKLRAHQDSNDLRYER